MISSAVLPGGFSGDAQSTWTAASSLAQTFSPRTDGRGSLSLLAGKQAQRGLVSPSIQISCRHLSGMGLLCESCI